MRYWITLATIVVLGGGLRWSALFDLTSGHYEDQRRSYFLAQGITTLGYVQSVAPTTMDIHRQLRTPLGDTLTQYNTHLACYPCWPADWHRRNTYPEVARRTLADNGNSLPFNWGLHAWLRTVGASFRQARIYAWGWGVLLIVGVGLLAWQLGLGPLGVGLSMLWASLQPLLILASQSHRALGMGMALAAFSTAYLLWLCRERRPLYHWLLLGLLAATTVLSYYLTAVLLVAWLWWLVPQRRARHIQGGVRVALLVGFGVLASWFGYGAWTGLELIAAGAEAWQQKKLLWNEDWTNLFAAPLTLRTFGVTALQTFAFYAGSTLQSWGWGLASYLPVFALLVLLIGKALQRDLHPTRWWPLAATLTPFATLACLALLSDNTLLLTFKYSILGAVFVAPLLGWVFSTVWQDDTRWRWAWRIGVLLFLILPALQVWIRFGHHAPRLDEYPEAAAARVLLAQHQPGDTLLLPTWDDAATLALHLPNHRDSQSVPVLRVQPGPRAYIRRRPHQPDSLLLAFPSDNFPHAP